MLSFHDIKEFQKHVYKYARMYPRLDMPWRKTSVPYHILLSEFMLQQTQVIRVIDYYITFITRWKTLESLARAQLSEILLQWKGLGYYRRARFLHLCSQYICKWYGGIIPSAEEKLLALPGIGKYTASAIVVFAYNKPSVMIETNIRRAIIYYFFRNKNKIDEKKIFIIVKESMDIKNPRKWYWALMDYGADVPKIIENPNRKSEIYKRQSIFHGSNRQIRSAVLRVIMDSEAMCLMERVLIKNTKEYLKKQGRIESDNEKIYKIIKQLVKESLIIKEKSIYTLPQ